MLKLTSKLIQNSNLKQQSTKLISTSTPLLSQNNDHDVDIKKIKSTHTPVKGYDLLRNPSLYKVK